MTQPKKLIEVALPIREISAESVRDKSIRHGHISTLHLWWARRPLPVCRAVVFASLVPDPLDEHCPDAFKDAVNTLLGGNVYEPYKDIPFTPAIDLMEDNPRHRLMMFIGRFSNEFVRAEKIGEGNKIATKDQLSNHSLIKWESKNDERILNIARKLIWVAHNAPKQSNTSSQQLITDFDLHYQAIKTAEKALYGTKNRHLPTPEVEAKEKALHDAIEAFLEHMPKVFDPFAGGGAIPLEAARLGCRSFGNDINPVAHIIQKGSLEFPQKYGKPITYSVNEFIQIYGNDELERQRTAGTVFGDEVSIANRLAFDVEYYAKKLLTMTKAEVGHLYPSDENENSPVAYYWTRIGICNNPACGAKIPLLKQFTLVNTPNKKFYLHPQIEGKNIEFEIRAGESPIEGWVKSRKSLECPICTSITKNSELKTQFLKEEPQERLLAVIQESDKGKTYRISNQDDVAPILNLPDLSSSIPEKLPIGNTKQFDVCPWGYETYGKLFSKRQLFTLQTFITNFQKIKVGQVEASDYWKSVLTYLGIFLNRIAVANTAFGVWHTGRETLERIMGRQAVAMVFDYPESNPFCNSSGSAANQIDWIIRYIESECEYPFATTCNNSSSGEKEQFASKTLEAVVTDPPYYDAIAYADLSDFFYVWLKRTLASEYPLNFAFPQTPKTEECTALKHHHAGDPDAAKKHFEEKLLQIFNSIEMQTKGVLSVMFAHQSTEAWTTLCNSILNANMNISSSWANDTEMTGALKKDKGFLSSSVTVTCRPSQKTGYGDFREVRNAIEATVGKEVKELYALGFRGADLLTACFGQAVGEFGKYEKVEKPNGDEVTVAELLEMAREAAFNAIVSDIATDDYTRFYIGWLNLFGFTQAEHDTVRKVTQIGLNTDVNELSRNHILIADGNKQTLASFAERIAENKKLGSNLGSFDIDKAHQLMHLYKAGNRGELLQYIAKMAGSVDNSVWRVLASLAEILPSGMDDHKQVMGLLTNKDSLIRESVKAGQAAIAQIKLDLN